MKCPLKWLKYGNYVIFFFNFDFVIFFKTRGVISKSK